MNLSDAGESRVRGYLYIFERAMRAAQPRALTDDAAREVESHIRERVAQVQPMPDEREALERILVQLGSPGTLARAYSLELMMDEAAVGGRFGAVLRTLFHMATTGVLGFFGAIALFVGYTVGVSFVLVAVLKPLFPANVGLWMKDGLPRSFGVQFSPPAGLELAGGYWVVPIALVVGLGITIATHKAARRWIAATRGRMQAVRAH